jgi:predicted nuclease of predicted toxin-antitoxin system
MNIYIDENLPPQLAEGLSILEKPNNDGVNVISIKKHFGEGTRDEDWIPLVGREGGIIITQDYNLHKNRHQRELYMQHGVSVFFITSTTKNGLSYWQMVELIISRWKEIKTLSRKTRKPFACKWTQRGRPEIQT